MPRDYYVYTLLEVTFSNNNIKLFRYSRTKEYLPEEYDDSDTELDLDDYDIVLKNYFNNLYKNKYSEKIISKNEYEKKYGKFLFDKMIKNGIENYDIISVTKKYEIKERF